MSDDSFDDSELEGVEPPRPPRAAVPMRVETVELRLTGDARVQPAFWEERVNDLLKTEEPADLDDFRSNLRALNLRDSANNSWSYDGSIWYRWDGTVWVAGRPTTSLHLPAVDIQVPVPKLPAVAREALGIAPDELPPPSVRQLPPPSSPTPVS